MRFSSRTPGDLSQNRIASILEKVGLSNVLDLTQSNPTRCGFKYSDELLSVLQDPAGKVYDPHPFGLLKAREILSVYLGARGEKVTAENIILTSSTSEAYSYLFKLLANPGDSILVPAPGYPLLDHLTRMDGVRTIPYPLFPKPGWPVDLKSLEASVQPHSRLIAFVNPNNPTGCYLKSPEYQFFSQICQKHQMALLLDEVFFEFSYAKVLTFQPLDSDTLTFRLGGLSKSLGLPQLKLSWISLHGPEKLLEECRDRLEFIADTYLSVNTPVQLGLKKLLETAPSFQKQLLDRVQGNRALLETCLNGREKLAQVWPAEGGWYALVGLKDCPQDEESFIIQLIEKQKVLVQPGSFYDFPSGFFLVVSLLPEKEIFKEGLKRLIRQLSSF